MLGNVEVEFSLAVVMMVDPTGGDMRLVRPVVVEVQFEGMTLEVTLELKSVRVVLLDVQVIGDDLIGGRILNVLEADDLVDVMVAEGVELDQERSASHSVVVGERDEDFAVRMDDSLEPVDRGDLVLHLS